MDTFSANVTSSTNTPLAYPRTGKRGVPQQFARRLYEMLQSEANLTATSTDYEVLISWSSSGHAFRIHDVDAFTVTVLPKYFRTKKFSSFQRNLNLYGFAKVRKGPETDMYAHSSFVRNKPELLTDLRKCTSASRRSSTSSKVSSSSTSSCNSSCSSSGDESDSGGSNNPYHQEEASSTSSSTTPSTGGSSSPMFPPMTFVQQMSSSPDSPHYPSWLSSPVHHNKRHEPNVIPKLPCVPSIHHSMIGRPGGIGMLDLLALAVEHAS